MPQPSNKGPLDWWKSVVLENYANFSGRARRAEFWWFYLITVVAMFVAVLVGSLISENLGIILVGIGGLAIIVPYLAVAVRRLHDTGKSGWWLLLSFVPFGFGGIVLLVFCFTDGTRGPNQYGQSPKYH